MQRTELGTQVCNSQKLLLPLAGLEWFGSTPTGWSFPNIGIGAPI